MKEQKKWVLRFAEGKLQKFTLNDLNIVSKSKGWCYLLGMGKDTEEENKEYMYQEDRKYLGDIIRS